ncbi:hypothetical protein BOX15_Mlig008995g1, partial [Macrostomum lignano]
VQKGPGRDVGVGRHQRHLPARRDHAAELPLQQRAVQSQKLLACPDQPVLELLHVPPGPTAVVQRPGAGEPSWTWCSSPMATISFPTGMEIGEMKHCATAACFASSHAAKPSTDCCRATSCSPLDCAFSFTREKSFPMSQTEFVDVASASSTSIKLRPIHNRLMSKPSRRCSEPPIETINYVRHFSNASLNVVTKAYSKSISDFVVEAQQSILHSNCGCYSHLLPFSVNTSDLCYFAPPQEWITPSDAVLKRIDCHDHWFQHATEEKPRASEAVPAPDVVPLHPATALAAEPQLAPVQRHSRDLGEPDGAASQTWSRVPAEDGKVHHIFRNSTETRQEIQLYMLARGYEGCNFNVLGKFNVTDLSSLEDYRRKIVESAASCIPRSELAKELAAVRISLQSPAADAYEEMYKYHWTEALSEIGGTLGLWLGISVVSTFELLEFIYILVQKCRRNDDDSDIEEES